MHFCFFPCEFQKKLLIGIKLNLQVNWKRINLISSGKHGIHFHVFIINLHNLVNLHNFLHQGIIHRTSAQVRASCSSPVAAHSQATGRLVCMHSTQDLAKKKMESFQRCPGLILSCSLPTKSSSLKGQPPISFLSPIPLHSLWVSFLYVIVQKAELTLFFLSLKSHILHICCSILGNSCSVQCLLTVIVSQNDRARPTCITTSMFINICLLLISFLLIFLY